jgi:hypothetical protein
MLDGKQQNLANHLGEDNLSMKHLAGLTFFGQTQFYQTKTLQTYSATSPTAARSKVIQPTKEESRGVVILSRDEWSNSFYTEIERNAIIDRTAVKNEGYHFLMVIPMIQGEIPPWYPSTQIYASPFGFSIEEIAHYRI